MTVLGTGQGEFAVGHKADTVSARSTTDQPVRGVLLRAPIDTDGFVSLGRIMGAHQVLSVVVCRALEHDASGLDEINLPNFPRLAIVARSNHAMFAAGDMVLGRRLGRQKETTVAIGGLHIPTAGFLIRLLARHQMALWHGQVTIVHYRSDPNTTIRALLDRPPLPRTAFVFCSEHVTLIIGTQDLLVVGPRSQDNVTTTILDVVVDDGRDAPHFPAVWIAGAVHVSKDVAANRSVAVSICEKAELTVALGDEREARWLLCGSHKHGDRNIRVRNKM